MKSVGAAVRTLRARLVGGGEESSLPHPHIPHASCCVISLLWKAEVADGNDKQQTPFTYYFYIR